MEAHHAARDSGGDAPTLGWIENFSEGHLIPDRSSEPEGSGKALCITLAE